MNSLNILSSRVIGQASPISNRPRSRSQGEITLPDSKEDYPRGRSLSEYNLARTNGKNVDLQSLAIDKTEEPGELESEKEIDVFDEKSPLLQNGKATDKLVQQSRLRHLVRRIADALSEGFRLVISTLGSPFVYVVSCFRDDTGHYSPIVPFKRLRRKRTSHKSLIKSEPGPRTEESEKEDSMIHRLRSKSSKESIASTTSESDSGKRRPRESTASRGSKQKGQSLRSTEELAPTRRSIRINLQNEASKSGKRRKSGRPTSQSSGTTSLGSNPENLTVDNIKSPTSPASTHKFTKYPHAPCPPRPLVPRRQPSHTASAPRPVSRTPQQKTLILDLDETLIHSLAKGGRMSSGHMVEVKLNAPVGFGNATVGPQHPILYYVHKRPHCDEFLRKVCKWYKLVVFTASVQEYADPVIDWLEQERKFFSARYYRQHCTYRNGAYIKDLGSVEPDLSKVMILDNSPMSYMFHEGTCCVFTSPYLIMLIRALRQRDPHRRLDQRPHR